MSLAVEDVSFSLGRFALRHVDLRVEDKEILAILGPNGAGKSVTLEAIAGFHRPESGRILIDDRDVTALPPERRMVGLVPQRYGLFPHLSVLKNVALGLRGEGHARRASDAAALLARFGIAHLAARFPGALSPGEMQRTALARALAMEPRVFLFDEPFAALDPQLRETLREELAAFLRGAKVPAVFVTHDRNDVTALADRVAVMREGRIVQEGPVARVFRFPATRFVAEFVGVENTLTARVLGHDGAGWRVALGGRELRVLDGAGATPGDAAEVCLCIRGDDVTLLAPTQGARGSPAANRFAMRVVRVSDLGALAKVVLEADFSLTACLTRRGLHDLGLTLGAEALVEVEPRAIHLLAEA